MSRSTQGSLIFQPFAVVHPQTLGRLHSIVETLKHQSGLRRRSVGGMSAPRLWHNRLSDLACFYLLHIHSRKGSKRAKETSQQSIPRHLQMLRMDGATLSRVCFRKVPAESPIYHDYTRMNEVTWLAEIWWDWIWVVQRLFLPARLCKTLWESTGHLFHPLRFSNKRKDLTVPDADAYTTQLQSQVFF